MLFLHSQFIIKKLGTKFHKTSDTSNPTFMKFGFLKERNLQVLEHAIKMLRQILVLRIGKVKWIWRKLRNTELSNLYFSVDNKKKKGNQTCRTCNTNGISFYRFSLSNYRVRMPTRTTMTVKFTWFFLQIMQVKVRTKSGNKAQYIPHLLVAYDSLRIAVAII
jgi:hypothetical protein